VKGVKHPGRFTVVKRTNRKEREKRHTIRSLNTLHESQAVELGKKKGTMRTKRYPLSLQRNKRKRVGLIKKGAPIKR